MPAPRVQDTQDKIVWDLYSLNGITYCLRCHINHASAIHEIVPRSQRPTTWMALDNRIPICLKCHDYAHSVGTGNIAEELIARRNLFIQTFGIRVPFDF
jgi:5-methylcytosine-specific restriction endonuclease McrA